MGRYLDTLRRGANAHGDSRVSQSINGGNSPLGLIIGEDVLCCGRYFFWIEMELGEEVEEMEQTWLSGTSTMEEGKPKIRNYDWNVVLAESLSLWLFTCVTRRKGIEGYRSWAGI